MVDAGSCDFVADVAVPYPLTVLSDLMGLPREDLPMLEGWIERIEAAQISQVPNEAAPVLGEMAPYLLEQIQRQKEAGEASLVTRLANAEVDGESLTDAEILVFFALLVFAGNDTTRNTLSGGDARAARAPRAARAAARRARADPGRRRGDPALDAASSTTSAGPRPPTPRSAAARSARARR